MQRDVLIIGGGVIGLTTAYELAREGVRVALVDRHEPGREASWAGAGILPPANYELATTPFNQLLWLSRQLYTGLSYELGQLTGIDNGYRECGGVELASHVSPVTIQSWRDDSIEFERLCSTALRSKEPGLSANVEDGYFLPQMAQVRNPRHLKALLAACVSLGVDLLPGTAIRSWRRNGERIAAAVSERGELAADQFLIAGGAWSDELLAPLGIHLGIVPVRGQIVLFNPGRVLLKMIVMAGRDYLVPRDDGRILVGSTEEHAGFVKETTAEAIGELSRWAKSLVPALADAPMEAAWAGLRPGTRDDLPYLGQVPGTSNLYIAAGHFRSGLMLSPGTGWVMAQLMMNQWPEIDLAPFALDRQ